MTTGWGIDPLKDANGVVTVGTTAGDLRQIQGGLYSPGLISGGVVTRSSSGLTYTVSPGVAAFPITTGVGAQTSLGPIPSQVITITAPASGSRTDIVYAQQRTVAIDGDPVIVVDYGPVLPARAVLLDSFIVSSGNTNSAAAVKNGNIAYSIPYGASLGLLVNKSSTFAGNFTTSATDISSSFFLPTDRLIRVALTASLSAYGAVRFDNSKYCEAGYDIMVDEVKKFSWSSQGLHQAWAETYWSGILVLPAGSHTIRTIRYRAQSPGTCVARGAVLNVEDIGPVV